MKAMILAAGFGTRLGELTKNTPKCLVQVGRSTMLELVVNRLRANGVTEIVINLHHLAQQVRDYVTANNNFGLTVQFSHEPEILETGGGLLAAWPYFANEPHIIVHNADVYCDANLHEMINVTKQTDSVATLAVMSRKTSRSLLFDSKEELIGWETAREGESPTVRIVREVTNPTRLAFAGIQIVSGSMLPYLQMSKGKFSIIESYLHAARAGGSVKAYRIDNAYWIDVGSPAQLEELRSYLARR